MAVIRELVLTNDKPRAEITLDVEILEVSRARTKELGLNLTQNQIGGIFSPEKLPPATGTTDGQPFNLNTITQGVSTADFYLTVPQAIVKFLQTRRQHAISRADAAARIRRRAALAEGRRRRAVSDDVVLPNRGGRRERQPAVVVHVPHRRHQRPGDTPAHHR